jgi:hypothetical protein
MHQDLTVTGLIVMLVTFYLGVQFFNWLGV